MLSLAVDKIHGREIVFKALVGSRAFDFVNKHSDYDYKVCLLPNSDDEGYYTRSIRPHKLVEYNIFTTPTIKEVFFDAEFLPVWFTDYFKCDEEKYPEIIWLRNNRESLFRANINVVLEKYLQHWENCKADYRLTQTDLYICYWILCILKRYHASNFKSLYDAVHLKRHEEEFKTAYNIKQSIINKEASIKLINKLADELRSIKDEFVTKSKEQLMEDFNSKLDSLTAKTNI